MILKNKNLKQLCTKTLKINQFLKKKEKQKKMYEIKFKKKEGK